MNKFQKWNAPLKLHKSEQSDQSVLRGNINGMDVYNHIRETNKTIPILFVSGNIEFLESMQKLKQKDSNLDNLSKPCPNKDYIHSINRLLEQKAAVKS